MPRGGRGAEIVAAGFDLRQAVGQHVDAAVHHDAGHHVGLVVGGGVTAHEIGQQVAQQRAVRQHGQVKMSENSSLNYTRSQANPPYFLPLTAPALD